jgi:glycosyltransferase involved in cell wall biosynthesis
MRGNSKFEPLVSIIIPVFNGVKYVCQAIDSAIAQTYENVEIIVVDDGSNDNTSEVIKRYGERIKFYHKDNGGVSTALNFGIEKSNGEYISWLSHDDIYHLDKIEKQIGILSTLNDQDRTSTVLYCSFEEMNEDNFVYNVFEPQKKYSFKKLNNPFWPVLAGLINGCTALFPKKCFDETGLFNPELRYTQDSEMWFRMASKLKFIFHPDILLISRKHSAQGTNNIDDRKENEDNALYINMVNKLNAEQMQKISGTELEFFKEMLDIVYGLNYILAAKYFEERIYKLNLLNKPIKMNAIKRFLLKIYSKHPMYKMFLDIQKKQEYLNKKFDFLIDKITKGEIEKK